MLSKLPDELLLQIADYVFRGDDDEINEGLCSLKSAQGHCRGLFLPKSSPVTRTWGYGTRTILDLSLVDRGTRAVVLELLASHVSVQLCSVPSLVRMYLKYPDLASKTKVLEIKRRQLTSMNILRVEDGHVFVPDDSLLQACHAVVWNDPSTDLLDKGIWMHELRTGKINALLAILFSILNNLETLQLQRIDVQQLSIFNGLFEPQWMRTWHRPPNWGCEYLEKVFGRQIARIEDLEMPRSWHAYLPDNKYYGLGSIDHIPVRSLSCFHSLRRVVAPESALIDTFKTFESHSATLQCDPSALLPQTLESLTIFNIDFRTAFKKQNHPVLNFLYILFTQIWQSTEAGQSQKQRSTPRLLPSLRYIYAEYDQTDAFFDHALTLQEWARVETIQEQVQQMGQFLGVEVEFSFPWVGDPFDEC